ncbi:MAG: diphosphomevalonate decarboxylase [Anaerolineae bacterium]
MSSATASAHPNLALVKYWGQVDPSLNLPANSSISVNLSGATTTTTVAFDPRLAKDEVVLNQAPADDVTGLRVIAHLDRVRALAGTGSRARVLSWNDFPAAAGIASPASAFAALSLAAVHALGLDLAPRELSVLARKGSGSACRSIPDGFVEWTAGTDDASSYAHSLWPCGYWDLRVVTITFRGAHKAVSSLEGHQAASSSPFYHPRLRRVEKTLDRVREALRRRDFRALGMAVEREAMSLHAVAMTSQPVAYPWLSGIYYWRPETLRVIRRVQQWREDGLPVYLTLDAGPSVHLLCEAEALDAVFETAASLLATLDAGTIVSRPGRGAWLVKETDGTSAPSDPSCSG